MARPGDAAGTTAAHDDAPVDPPLTPLQREMEQQGNWLFQRRTLLPAPLLIVLLVRVLLAPVREPPLLLGWGWEAFALGVGLAGLVWRGWVAGHVPTGTSGRNRSRQVAETLNTTGPYSLVRHPLYVGNFLMWMGPALLTGSILAVLLAVAYFWIGYERIMIAEEAFLRGKFGRPYDDWARTTPAAIPAFAHWTPSSLDFSWRTAIRREYTSFIALMATLGVMELAEEMAVEGRVTVDPMWQVILAASAVAYLVVRFLKKRTRVLDVPGR